MVLLEGHCRWDRQYVDLHEAGRASIESQISLARSAWRIVSGDRFPPERGLARRLGCPMAARPGRSYRRLAAATFQTSYSDQHRRIVDAIAAGHDTVAFDAMTGHLEEIGTAFQTLSLQHTILNCPDIQHGQVLDNPTRRFALR
jgi:hypothetical protein